MNLFNELKRRNVFKVAAAYLIVSWLILQIIGSIVPTIEVLNNKKSEIDSTE